MHNNYFFLKVLAPELDLKLGGKQLVSCYSQEKDELMLIFADSREEFIIRAHLQPAFSCLYFPSQNSRARRNTIDLFSEILHKKVRRTYCHENERAITLELDEPWSLTFKLFGNRSNIILFDGIRAAKIFRTSLKNDLEINLPDLNRSLDLSYNAFEAVDGNPAKFLPTLGKPGREYLFKEGYRKLPIEKQYGAVMELVSSLGSPSFHIVEWQDQILFSLVELGSIRSTFTDPIEGLNEFYLTYMREGNLLQEKRRAGDAVRKDLERSLRYLEKNEIKLIEIRDETNYRHLADLIMANMHQIQQGEKKVLLPDFYNGNKPVEIKLKPELSPQKNAENYYRKAKNQHLEIDRLEKNIRLKREQMQTLKELLHQIEEAESVRDLKKIIRSDSPVKDGDQGQRPYHVFNFMGFQIWLGKSGKANDLMLQQCHKDDLWLHAKDVAGAHVIVKFNSGMGFPAGVKEKAASLAAFHSKRRNDSLCPVIATPKKFIRKRKGSPPGEVAVDREEEILLVTPQNWD